MFIRTYVFGIPLIHVELSQIIEYWGNQFFLRGIFCRHVFNSLAPGYMIEIWEKYYPN